MDKVNLIHVSLLGNMDKERIPNASWTPDRLMKFWDVYRNASKKMGTELLGNRPKAALQSRKLANFAANLAAMKMCEKNGSENGVSVYKNCAEVSLKNVDSDVVKIAWSQG